MLNPDLKTVQKCVAPIKIGRIKYNKKDGSEIQTQLVAIVDPGLARIGPIRH